MTERMFVKINFDGVFWWAWILWKYVLKAIVMVLGLFWLKFWWNKVRHNQLMPSVRKKFIFRQQFLMNSLKILMKFNQNYLSEKPFDRIFYGKFPSKQFLWMLNGDILTNFVTESITILIEFHQNSITRILVCLKKKFCSVLHLINLKFWYFEKNSAKLWTSQNPIIIYSIARSAEHIYNGSNCNLSFKHLIWKGACHNI